MSGKPALGLYFSDQYIEISQLSADGMRLVRFNQLPLPPDVVVNGEIKNPAGLTSILIQLLSSARPHPVRIGEDVVIGVSDNRVFLREFSLPKFPGKEIEEAIDWQVRSLLPVLPAGVETDWQIMGRSVDDQIEVLLSAIPKSVIESYISVATAGGLQVVAVEPAVFANIRIIKPEIFKGKNQLLVYVGDTFAEFTYITNGNPRFSDFLPFSEISKKGDIVNVISDYVIFASSKHPGRPVSEIVVSGFSASTKAIFDSLVSRKSAAILATSRLATTQVPDHGLLRTSQGLSLATFDPVLSTNLLPLDFRLDVVRRRLLSGWKSVLIFLIVVTLFSSLGLYYLYQQALDRETELSTLKQVYQQQLNEPFNKELIERAGLVNQLTDRLVLLREITGGENLLLRQISAIVPEGISLTSLVYARGSGSMKLSDPKSTWAITGVANSRDVVLEFYDKLLIQPGFINGRLYFGSLEKETAINFRIASQQTK